MAQAIYTSTNRKKKPAFTRLKVATFGIVGLASGLLSYQVGHEVALTLQGSSEQVALDNIVITTPLPQNGSGSGPASTSQPVPGSTRPSSSVTTSRPRGGSQVPQPRPTTRPS